MIQRISCWEMEESKGSCDRQVCGKFSEVRLYAFALRLHKPIMKFANGLILLEKGIKVRWALQFSRQVHKLLASPSYAIRM